MVAVRLRLVERGRRRYVAVAAMGRKMAEVRVRLRDGETDEGWQRGCYR